MAADQKASSSCAPSRDSDVDAPALTHCFKCHAQEDTASCIALAPSGSGSDSSTHMKYLHAQAVCDALESHRSGLKRSPDRWKALLEPDLRSAP